VAIKTRDMFEENQKPLVNPLNRYPKPPFVKQPQEVPGLASKMDPVPDHGEKSYKAVRL
jgi:hypothetical protein